MLRLIFWIVVGVLALSYFGISLRGIVDSPAAADNIGFIKDLVMTGWNYVHDLVIHLIDLVKNA